LISSFAFAAAASPSFFASSAICYGFGFIVYPDEPPPLVFVSSIVN